MNKLRITIKAARINAGLEQKEAAERIGVTNQTLINWEKGRTVPTIDYAIRMCEVYGVSLNDLIFSGKNPIKLVNADEETS